MKTETFDVGGIPKAGLVLSGYVLGKGTDDKEFVFALVFEGENGTETEWLLSRETADGKPIETRVRLTCATAPPDNNEAGSDGI